MPFSWETVLCVAFIREPSRDYLTLPVEAAKLYMGASWLPSRSLTSHNLKPAITHKPVNK